MYTSDWFNRHTIDIQLVYDENNFVINTKKAHDHVIPHIYFFVFWSMETCVYCVYVENYFSLSKTKAKDHIGLVCVSLALQSSGN